MRIVLVLVGWLTWAIPLFILIAGSRFFVSCLSVLVDPRVPFTLTYQTSKGPATVTVERYTYRPKLGQLAVRGFRLYDADGALIVRANEISIVNAGIYDILNPAPKIYLRSVVGIVSRSKIGKINIEDILPSSVSSGGSFPIELLADDCKLTFTDESTPHVLRQKVLVPHARIAHVDKEWLGAAVVEIGTSSPVRVFVDGTSENLTLGTRFKDFQVPTPMIDWSLTQTDRARGVKVGGLSLNGPFSLRLRNGKSITAYSEIEVKTTKIEAQGVQLKSVTWVGNVTESAVRGQVVAISSDGSQVVWQGGANLNPLQVLGKLRAVIPSEVSIPARYRKQVGHPFTFRNGRFEGWVAAASDLKPKLDGELTVDQVSADGKAVNGVRLGLQTFGTSFVAGPGRLNFQNQTLTGLAVFTPGINRISAGLVAKNVDLATLSSEKWYPKGIVVKGRTDLQAIVGGTLKNPTWRFRISGQAKVAAQNRALNIQHFNVDASLDHGVVTVQRGYLSTPQSAVTVIGGAHLNGQLTMDLEARGLDAWVIDPSISGAINLAISAEGTVSNPQLKGRVEAYGLTYRGRVIPALTADLVANRQGLHLPNFYAIKGAAHAEGRAWYRWSDGMLAANLTAGQLRLADVLGDEFVGGLKIDSAAVGGSLKNPSLHAKVSGQNWVVRGIKVDQIQAELFGDNKTLSLARMSAEGIEGRVLAHGKYHIKDKRGDGIVTAEHLALGDLAPELTDQLTVDGHLSGQASVALNPDGTASAVASGTVAGVGLSGTALGGGPWSLNVRDNVATGSAEFGQLDAYARIPNFKVDLLTKIAAASFDVYNFNLEDVAKLAKVSASQITPELSSALNEVAGRVSASGLITVSSPATLLDVETLSGSGLKYRDIVIGDLDASLSAGSQRVTINRLNISGPTGNLQAKGTADLDGAVALDAELEQFDLASLRTVLPSLTGIKGTLTSSVLVRGTTKAPEIRATAELEGLTTQKNSLIPSPQENLSVFVSDLTLNKETGLTADGSVSYHGFSAEFSGQLPTVLPTRIPENPAVKAQITVKPRTLAEIIGSEKDSPWVSILDPARSDGVVSGILTANGTLSDPHLAGSVTFNSKQIGLSGVDDRLGALSVALSLKGSLVDFSASGNGSRGGDFSVGLATDIKDVLRRLTSGTGEPLAESDVTLKGQARLRGVKFKQGLPEKKYVEGAVSGDIVISGPVRSPLIQGNISLFGFNSEVPALETATKPPIEWPIDPLFDLKFNLGSPARVRAATVDVSLVGEGSLSGRASQPVAKAEMEVDSGTIRLPGGLLRVESGGTVTLNYRSIPGDTVANLKLDMIGNTSLTTVAYGDTVGRYDISVVVTGDLLQSSGLTLVASSDPPGLTQDRILALLGSTDVLEAIGGTSTRNTAQERIRNAVAGYAIPTLFEPITSGFAKGLGFQYLNLDYNTTDLASLSFAKAFSSELFVQGRRQLAQTRPNLPIQYDLRLVYRPRRVKGFLQRLSLSLGTDQDRPWKISVDYGTRF